MKSSNVRDVWRLSMIGALVVAVWPTIGLAGIYRWDNGQLIPGTAGIEPGPGIKVPGLDLSFAALRNMDLTGSDFTGTNLSHARLHESKLIRANFTNANLSDSLNYFANWDRAILKNAEVRGAWFDSFPGLWPLTKEQWYSTASYQNKNLSGITLRGDLRDFSFVGQNLSGASLPEADLTNSNWQDATIVRVTIVPVDDKSSFTPAMLYSTASYKQKDLSGLNFRSYNDSLRVEGWDFSGQKLTGARFSMSLFKNSNFTDADLTLAQLRPAIGMDLRGATVDVASLGNPRSSILGYQPNFLLPDGTMYWMDVDYDKELSEPQTLRIRDYKTSMPISVSGGMEVGDYGTLQIEFDGDGWGSTIKLAAESDVHLSGQLVLSFAPGVSEESQVGKTFRVFDWNGSHRTGSFKVQRPERWDLSKLYTTGEVTLLAVPEPVAAGMFWVGLLAFAVTRRRRSHLP